MVSRACALDGGFVPSGHESTTCSYGFDSFPPLAGTPASDLEDGGVGGQALHAAHHQLRVGHRHAEARGPLHPFTADRPRVGRGGLVVEHT